MQTPAPHIFDRLFAAIKAKRRGDPATSYTASLFRRGVPKIAQKLGEETTETIIEAVRGDKARLREESADLLYHLFVLWAAAGITPDQVGKILSKRFGQSGIAEKAQRSAKK
ncbi:MAG: phosphoribosyl-ATP diphosphatase [Alphaproteobacteria bacterium]